MDGASGIHGATTESLSQRRLATQCLYQGTVLPAPSSLWVAGPHVGLTLLMEAPSHRIPGGLVRSRMRPLRPHDGTAQESVTTTRQRKRRTSVESFRRKAGGPEPDGSWEPCMPGRRCCCFTRFSICLTAVRTQDARHRTTLSTGRSTRGCRPGRSIRHSMQRANVPASPDCRCWKPEGVD